jgi:hypothetical protein
MSLILDGTNGLSDVDGSAATPAIRGTDANTGIFFPAADTIAFAEGGVESARFNSSGNLQTIGTISVGNATPSTSGAGITFPATQSASSDANTLDDYEEGTFTPSFTPIAGSATYTNQVGNYVKIGRKVTAVFYITVNVSSSLTTGLIAGLPFTGSNTNYAGTVFSVWSGIGGYCNLLGLTAASTTIQTRATSSATAAPTVVTLTVSNGAEIAGTVTYFTS